MEIEKPPKIKLHELHFKKLNINSTFGIVGRRGSGKSTVIKTIMYYISPYIRLPILFSHTADKNKEYDRYIPSSLIYSHYKPSLVAEMILDQEKRLTNKNRNKRKKIQALIAFDDVVAQIKLWKNDTKVIEMFTEGRHTKITTILGVHDIKDLVPKIRNQFDYVILTGEDRKTRRDFFFDTYWPQRFIADKKQFNDIVDEGTRGYRSLVINIRQLAKPNSKFSNCVFYIRPPNPKKLPNFRIGNKYYWRYHKQNYDKNWRIEKWKNYAKQNKSVEIQPIKKTRSKYNTKKTTITIPKMNY